MNKKKREKDKSGVYVCSVASERITVRYTASEKESIERLALAHGVSTSDYVRNRSLGKPVNKTIYEQREKK